MNEFKFKTDAIDAHYDDEEKLLTVVYTGVLSPEVTSQFYGWMISLMQNQPHLINEVKGSIFDFREVTEFMASNISTARRESINAQNSGDMSNIPVALLVETMLQERMVASTMRLTQQTDRKKLVHSMEQAKAFIDEWHEEND